jgi:tRNA threonylcarbamoyladenosine biosynthesis protein TsaE
MELVSRSPGETLAFGEALGRSLGPGDVLALIGELGAGKTWLTKGVAAGLGVPPAEVTSPTFVLLHLYRGRLELAHFDAYRLRRGQELLDLGADEQLYGDGACVVEWADRVRDALPADRLEIEIEAVGENERRLTLRPLGRRSTAALARLRLKERGASGP